MANVIAGKEKIGRPIRLKQRRLETVVAQLVFIGVNQIDVRMRLQEFHNLEKSVRLDDVIMIEKRDPLTAGECQSLISSSRDALMLSERFQDDTPIAGGKQRQCTEQIGSARSIVD